MLEADWTLNVTQTLTVDVGAKLIASKPPFNDSCLIFADVSRDVSETGPSKSFRLLSRPFHRT